MFHFGFSCIGFIYFIMLIVPNILWSKNKPVNYDFYVKNENLVLLLLERVGEILVTCFSLFSNIKITIFSIQSLFLLLSFLFMLLYEMYWVRYFNSEKTMHDFYRTFFKIPLAGATLPVLAYFLLGIYGKNIFLLVSTILLGIGHIGIHFNHKKEIIS